MKRLPQKISLAAQAAAVLRENIEAGRWIGWLPGEHELSAQLHVSRKTVRAALEWLRREGVVKCRPGRRREIIKGRLARRKPAGHRVVVLAPVPLDSLNPLVEFVVDRLREHLMAEGFVLETHVSRRQYRVQGRRGWESLAQTLDPAGWVLLDSTEAMQKWFAARGLPCVVIGSCYNGIQLPSVDRDYRAVCQHAVNQFVAHGHRRLALLNPRPAAAGDILTARAFMEAADRTKTAGLQARVQEHDGSIASICASVTALMAGAQPCRAFLVSRAQHFLTVLGHVLSAGLRVPKDVALISRDDAGFLADVVPTAARYSHNPNLFASRLSRLVMETLAGDARVKNFKIMPIFIRGQTLG